MAKKKIVDPKEVLYRKQKWADSVRSGYDRLVEIRDLDLKYLDFKSFQNKFIGMDPNEIDNSIDERIDEIISIRHDKWIVDIYSHVIKKSADLNDITLNDFKELMDKPKPILIIYGALDDCIGNMALRELHSNFNKIKSKKDKLTFVENISDENIELLANWDEDVDCIIGSYENSCEDSDDGIDIIAKMYLEFNVEDNPYVRALTRYGKLLEVLKQNIPYVSSFSHLINVQSAYPNQLPPPPLMMGGMDPQSNLLLSKVLSATVAGYNIIAVKSGEDVRKIFSEYTDIESLTILNKKFI